MLKHVGNHHCNILVWYKFCVFCVQYTHCYGYGFT